MRGNIYCTSSFDKVNLKFDGVSSCLKLTGLKKMPVTLTWHGDNCTTVEISGLDIGWGQVIFKSHNGSPLVIFFRTFYGFFS